MKSSSCLPLTPSSSELRQWRWRGVVAMILSVMAFTTNTMLLRHLGDHAGGGPEVALLFRAVVGTLLVVVFFRGAQGVRFRPVFRDRSLILRGMTGLLGTAAYYWTIPSLGAGKATLITNTYIVFASFIAMFTLGERLQWKRLLWLGSAFLGIVLLVGPDEESRRLSVGWPETIALLGAGLAAWAVVLVRQLSQTYSIGTIYLAQCLWILLPIAVLAAPSLSALDAPGAGLLLLAALAAGGGQLAMNEGFRCLDVTTGASIQTLWPVGTTFGGWLLFDERFGAGQWLGAVLILASILKIAASKPSSNGRT